MKSKHILKYTTNCFLLLMPFFSISQADNNLVIIRDGVEMEVDTTDYKEDFSKRKKNQDFIYAIRLGIDLSKPIRSYVESDYNGIEFVADFRISNNLYIATEGGVETKKNKENLFTYTSSGNYIKGGLDFNFFGRRYYLENLVFVGFRIATSSFYQDLERYSIYLTSPYWDENSKDGNDLELLGKHDNLSFTWIEILFGFKAEVYRNIYLGASVRFNFKRSSIDYDKLPNQWVPSFNEVIFQNPFSASYNYTITYQIPIVRHRKIFKKKKPIDLESE